MNNLPSIRTPAIRSCTYDPPPDVVSRQYWKHLKSDQRITEKVRNLMTSKFTFPALPYSECLYLVRYCVPFPGVNFEELPNNECTFSMSTEVLEAVGDTGATAFEDLWVNEIAVQATESFGDAVGDHGATIDAFVSGTGTARWPRSTFECAAWPFVASRSITTIRLHGAPS